MFLIAHCPKFGCYTRVPIWKPATNQNPEWLQSNAYVVVICPRCGEKFRELASALEASPTAN
jgi:predicted nucleic-acid-binding Zn-ribbon protein